MLPVIIHPDRIQIGERFSISFQRTLRLPEDGQIYPLPPSLGNFPLRRVEDYADKLLSAWAERGGAFFPIYQREALWLSFEAASWKPNAVKIGVGRINALTGAAWDEKLHSNPQDYLVCPNQPWLDGVVIGEGVIRQFVAMPLDEGYTIEAQLTGEEQFGGMQILVLDPKPGIFPDQPPPETLTRGEVLPLSAQLVVKQAPQAEMGLAAGGKMTQKVYPDPYGLSTWDENLSGKVEIHLVNSQVYLAITGEAPPPSPVSAKTYTEYGFPWFELYDEHLAALPSTDKLAEVKSISELQAEKGETVEETPLDILKNQIRKIFFKKGSRSSH